MICQKPSKSFNSLKLIYCIIHCQGRTNFSNVSPSIELVGITLILKADTLIHYGNSVCFILNLDVCS